MIHKTVINIYFDGDIENLSFLKSSFVNPIFITIAIAVEADPLF